jgi:predicted phosphodiesterase
MKMKAKVAVISDIHANANALTVALKKIQSTGVDMTIVLGDVLTYGCQPIEVINKLKQYKKENAVVFIKGNHDQFYFNLRKGMTLMKNKMVSLC